MPFRNMSGCSPVISLLSRSKCHLQSINSICCLCPVERLACTWARTKAVIRDPAVQCAIIEHVLLQEAAKVVGGFRFICWVGIGVGAGTRTVGVCQRGRGGVALGHWPGTFEEQWG